MKRVKIKFSSVTHAMNAKDIIQKNGGRVSIGKNTNPGMNEGCGYFLIVIGEAEKIMKILKINSIKIVGYDYI
ncbi:MAG: hypothetical protein J6B37_04795 [Clostridia bacterium]|nr:hypothetical protein [Clostridia bacterium]